MSNQRPLALVTGASSGIGMELARLLAADGHDLVVAARSEDGLQRLAEELRTEHGCSVRVSPHDLAAAETPRRIFEELRNEGASVEVLVNNAGFGDLADFASMDESKMLGMMQVNMVALTHLSHLFVAGMVERGSGRILNVASTAGFQPGPGMGVYYATKAYVISLTEALAKELEGTGVTATCLCPGPVTSGFQAVANLHGSRFAKFATFMEPRPVANSAYRALKKGSVMDIPGIQNRVMAQSVRFTPRAMIRSLVRFMNRAA